MEYDVSYIGAVKRAEDVWSFRFELPTLFTYKAGQFVKMSLGGQSRYLSLSSSPSESGYFEVTTRRSNSGFKQALFNMVPGHTATISEAMGAFRLDKNSKSHAFLSGGIGVTPVRSIIRTLYNSGEESDVTLFLGNNNPSTAVFSDELREIASSWDGMKLVEVFENSGEGCYQGFINEDIVKDELEGTGHTYYVCGPPAMVEAMSSILDSLGIPEEKRVLERFSGC